MFYQNTCKQLINGGFIIISSEETSSSHTIFNNLGSIMSVGFPRTVDCPPPRCRVLDLTQKSKRGTSQLEATCCTMLNRFSCVQLFETPRTAPGSSVHGILQARILGWVATSFSQGIFLPQGLNPSSLIYLLCQADSLPLAPPGEWGYLLQVGNYLFIYKMETINKLWKILRDGNTSPSHLSPEKPVCESRSNS